MHFTRPFQDQSETAGNARTANVVRRLVTLAVIIVLISPAVRDRDGLPLSTYPMYAGTRSNFSSYVTAVGITKAGETQRLSSTTIAETMDSLIAQSFLNDAVARGESHDLCGAIATRVSGRVVAIEIATERHDTIARLRGQPSLLDRELHTRCEVD